ncbi:putative phosphatidate phosphatase [Helianthus annuus]|nr:putative phosphatidate phosphatase [Helianthus annuus]
MYKQSSSFLSKTIQKYIQFFGWSINTKQSPSLYLCNILKTHHLFCILSLQPKLFSKSFNSSLDFHTSRPKNTMVEAPTRVVDGDKCSDMVDTTVDAFEQEVLIDSGSESNRQTSCVHIVLNRSSIWCVAVTYYGVILLRRDDLALSGIVGSVLNVLLSFTLKQILNQERPVSEVCSGPGMPSTHAQSISFAAIFFILSIIGWLGLNGLSIMLIVLIIAIGVYFSWLRVLLCYHTTSQVVAGLVVGSIFSVLWFCTCDEMIYNLVLWMR